MGAPLADGGDLARAPDVGGAISAPPPVLLASTSPQRRAILTQLGIPFDVEPPRYEEDDPPGLGPVEAVEAHARGKASSVADAAGGRPVLGVDTEVVLDGRVYGKPENAAGARAMLSELTGRTHEVVSGLCLIGSGFTDVAHEVTRVTFRALAPTDVDAYVALGEWKGRAGGYAIQGRGAALVDAIDGDYTNVVGLPLPTLLELAPGLIAA